VRVSREILVAGTLAELTLQARDAEGHTLRHGGAAVAFQVSGGTATGILTATTDRGDGTYVATFTGVGAGTATTVGATIDGRPVTRPLPTIQVVPGPVAPATTYIQVTPRTIVVGERATLEVVTRDHVGNQTGSGGGVVVFTASGGSGTGTIGPVTDHGDGRYTALFTASGAGSPITIGATVDGTPVLTPLPVLTVARGVSADSSTVVLSSDTISVNAGLTVRLQVRDSAGIARTSGGDTVRFLVQSGPGSGAGTIDSTTDHDDGSYTAAFTATAAGSGIGITATLNGRPLTGPPPQVTILAIPIAPQQSTVSISQQSVQAGQTVTFTAAMADEGGNPYTTPVSVVFTLSSDGTSGGSVGPTTDHGDGSYTATFTALTAGTPVEIGAMINDTSQIQMLDSLGVSHLPLLTVTPGPASPDSSRLSASPATLNLGDSATIVLSTVDGFGNLVGQGGRAVVFQRAGGPGSSSGTIRGEVDHGDGRYSAYYVSDAAGAGDTIRAILDGVLVSSGMPTITVVCTPGPVSLVGSVMTVNDTTAAARPVSQVTLPSGVTTTITLQARDSRSCPVTAPLTVVFSTSGGGSTGQIGPTVDQGDGSYTATFTGLIAGTAATVGATVDGAPVTSAPATITVIPGDISPLGSEITVSPAAIDSGARATVTLQARDSAGNALTRGGRMVTFALAGISPHGAIGPTTDRGDGTYAATYTALVVEPGVPDSVSARIDGTPVRTPAPGVEVVAGSIALDQSLLTVTAATVVAGDSVRVTLQGRDALGRSLVTGDRAAVIAFTQAGGSGGTFTAVQNPGDGSYHAYFIGRTVGGPATLGATIDGAVVTTSLPAVTVVAGPASPATSFITLAVDSLGVGDTTTVALQVLDAFGNPVSDAGLLVVHTVTPASVGVVGTAGFVSPSRYTAILTSAAIGTAQVSATIDGVPVTTAAPTIRVE